MQFLLLSSYEYLLTVHNMDGRSSRG